MRTFNASSDWISVFIAGAGLWAGFSTSASSTFRIAAITLCAAWIAALRIETVVTSRRGNGQVT